uniref:Cytochrome c oxidase copper chaperone n=2 Tax=Loa loa TaxID=7209 RepID=A0A1I7VM24_LOALO
MYPLLINLYVSGNSRAVQCVIIYKTTDEMSDDKGCSISSKDSGTKKPKPCCACPETKKARDECMILFGEEHCGELIEAHKKCMRQYGYEV